MRPLSPAITSIHCCAWLSNIFMKREDFHVFADLFKFLHYILLIVCVYSYPCHTSLVGQLLRVGSPHPQYETLELNSGLHSRDQLTTFTHGALINPLGFFIVWFNILKSLEGPTYI